MATVHNAPPDLGVVDQALTAPNDLGCSINEAFAYVAQTYVAGIDGVLGGVNIAVWSHRSSNKEIEFPYYPLVIEIRDVEGGYPARILARTVLNSDGATMADFIGLKTEVRQVAGNAYAIVVHYEGAPAAGPGKGLGVWTGATGNQYPPGELLYGPDGQSWFASSVQNHDLHFRTYVIPD